MKAANENLTDSQATEIVAAIRAGDFGKMITEEVAKRKAELEQEGRDEQLKEAETEGSSRGETMPEGPPKNINEAKGRVLNRLRG